MDNMQHSAQIDPQHSQIASQPRRISGLVVLGLGCFFPLWSQGVGLGISQVVALPRPVQLAAESDAPPAQLTDLLSQIDTAASEQDLEALMAFYGEDFSQSDGLNRQGLKQVLKAFWQDYSTLKYQTELRSWKLDGPDSYSTETITTITGVKVVGDLSMDLNATLRSQQQFVQGKMIRQDILSERSQLTSGTNPPKVTVNLPEQVGIGQPFNFDVIVDQPLGEGVLLGATLEEPITAQTYSNRPAVQLEALPAGGLFKVGRAPNQPSSEWLSAVLIQDGGIIAISQRLNIVAREKVANPSVQSP